MIVSSCPLRVSLVGGSTDHPEFLKKYKKGSVISFASNLKSYTILHRDVIGYNSFNHKYIINYSEKECVDSIHEIKNDLIRYCFEEMQVDEINCFLTSDIFSSGSGLASSSSYLMSLIKSINFLDKKELSIFEICDLAKKIERKFNPLVGEQDFYGGSIGGLKRINFKENGPPDIEQLDDEIFNHFDMYLYYTAVDRSSTSVLKTLNIDSSLPLLEEVDNLYKSIKEVNTELFLSTINKSWSLKKETSPNICSGELSVIDSKIESNKNVLAHKLCGAGGGGYFLLFAKKDSNEILIEFPDAKKIQISKNGLTCTEI